MPTSPDRTDRILGSLVGLAAGDCLGGPVEGSHPEKIRARFGVLRDFPAGPAPLWTGDTQQALVLVEATVRHGLPDPDWVGRRFVMLRRGWQGRRFGLHRGTGRGFRESVRAFETTGDWRRAGRLDRAGNGAAMRIAPIGAALAGRKEEELVRVVTEVSLLTHRERRALAGALGVAWVAARLALAPGFPLPRAQGRALLDELVVWLEGCEDWLASAHPDTELRSHAFRHDVSRALGRVALHWDESLTARLHAVERFASERFGEPLWATAGFVLCSVVTAIALVLGAEEDFETTLIRTVNLGGDSDTMGAMVGGMAGAAAGLGAIPERWQHFPGAQELRAWGQALAHRIAEDDAAGPGAARVRKVDLGELPDLLQLERDLTARLEHARRTRS